jgi:hypothetical protein
MPVFVVAVVILLVLGFVAPRATKWVIVGPLIGVAIGGFAWAVAAMIFEGLINWTAFGVFIAIGVVAGEVFVTVVDR